MTRADQILATLKNNRLVAIAIVAGIIIISVASFFDALSKLNPFKKAVAVASSDGIIADPSIPENYYHNARVFELGGDIKNAKYSYSKYFESDQDYIDPHLFYQELLKNSDGIDGARQVYQDFALRYPSSMKYKFLLLRLADRQARVECCSQLYKMDSAYMPVIFQLIQDYTVNNSTEQTLNDEMTCMGYFRRFIELNRNNGYFKYFIDKKEAIKAINFVQKR